MRTLANLLVCLHVAPFTAVSIAAVPHQKADDAVIARGQAVLQEARAALGEADELQAAGSPPAHDHDSHHKGGERNPGLVGEPGHDHGHDHASDQSAAHAGSHQEKHGGHGRGLGHGHGKETSASHPDIHAEEHGGHSDFEEATAGHTGTATQHEHGSHGAHQHGEDAHAVAVGLVATVILIPLVISMALSDGLVHELTMKMLDTFTSIFLAVLWFNTFRQFFETFDVGYYLPYAEEILALVQIFALYGIAMVIAWLWRNKTMRLTTFCSCGAHFIAFAGINFSGESQHTISKSVPHYVRKSSVFAFCVIVGGVLALMFVANYFLWRRHTTSAKLNEAIDELELDVLGLVLSFVITQAVRTALTGRYPPLHFLQMVGAPVDFKHQPWQRFFMLGWSVSLIILAGLAMPKLNDMAHRSPVQWIHRLVHVLKVVLIMLIAWGFLLWGEWEFYENLFTGNLMFGHMLFAVFATLVCLGVLFLMAKCQTRARTREAHETNSITTTGISLVAAWSWEHCFNVAFDIIGNEYEVGYQGLVPKLVLSVVVPAALLPTYLQHVRKRVLAFEEEAEHKHSEHQHSEHP